MGGFSIVRLRIAGNIAEKVKPRSRAALSDESGAVVIIVALLLVALLVVVALVIDLGGLYDHDRELQTAADAGALAGAQELFYTKGDTGAAQTKTTEYVELNQAPNSSVDGTNVAYEKLNIDARSVEVQLRESGVEFVFAPVIGETEGSVTAYAKAELMYLTGTNSFFPVALPYVHPHHFRIIYENGENDVAHDLFNEESGTDSDQGYYDREPESPTANLSPGLHAVSLTARDKNDTDLFTWADIGSVFVPPAGSVIQRVSVYRDINVPADPEGDLTETLHVELVTSGVPVSEQVKVKIEWGKNNSSTVTLRESSPGSGLFSGEKTMTVDDSDFGNGAAPVTVTTVGSKKGVFPDGVLISSYTWYQRGSALVYVTWDPSTQIGGSSTLDAVVRTKVLKFDSIMMLKPSLASEGTYQGNDFWADFIKSENCRTEIEAALGIIPPDPDWQLNPDIGDMADDPSTLGNGYADIGEYLPYDNGVSVGHWSWVDSWFKTAPKPVVVYIPIVDPGTKKNGWKIQGFAAFEITDWRDQGNRVAIIGRFVRWLDGGQWSPDKPPIPIYVETAVLTDGQH